MAYSLVSDLLLGDLAVSVSVNKQKFIDDAAEEIDSKLGFVYELPLSDLPSYQKKLLKLINNKLASGRLILTLAIGGEDTALHAYGLRLVTEATNELMLIANGGVELDATSTATIDTSNDMRPVIHNHDAESAVDIFEASVMRGQSAYWNPGAVVSRRAGG